MLASSSNFFTANVIIDRITWECILYYMESEEFIKIAKKILGEEKYNEYKLSPQGNARIFGLAITGLVFQSYSDEMADDLELVKSAAAHTTGMTLYGAQLN